MKPYARYCMYALLLLELTSYSAWYLISIRGRRVIVDGRQDLAKLELDILTANNALTEYSQELQDWELYPFYHEKQARELQYIFPGDEIYMIASPKT